MRPPTRARSTSSDSALRAPPRPGLQHRLDAVPARRAGAVRIVWRPAVLADRAERALSRQERCRGAGYDLCGGAPVFRALAGGRRAPRGAVRRRPGVHASGTAGTDAERRRGAADHRVEHRRRAPVVAGAAPVGGARQHHRDDRAPPGCAAQCRLDYRPWAGGRPQRRPGGVQRHAGAGGAGAAFAHRAISETGSGGADRDVGGGGSRGVSEGRRAGVCI
eukprot:ctg_3193.g551